MQMVINAMEKNITGKEYDGGMCMCVCEVSRCVAILKQVVEEGNI